MVRGNPPNSGSSKLALVSERREKIGAKAGTGEWEEREAKGPLLVLGWSHSMGTMNACPTAAMSALPSHANWRRREEG